MALEPAVVIFDACLLYPFHLRNIMVQVAVDRLVLAHWTDEIHDEWTRSLLADRPDLPIERLAVTRRLMETALPGARLDGYQDLIPRIDLPDPGDRHVVAAGVVAGASLILTWNQRDFPTGELKKHGLRVQDPDDFLADLHDMSPELIVASLANARRNLSRSHVSTLDFVGVLRRLKLIRLATQLESRLRDL
jgi:hypothetical protein